MKRKLLALTAIMAVCLLAALPATAANVFAFTEKSIILFEGETVSTALNQDGTYAEGEIVYSSESAKVATVTEDGAVTAVAKGKTRIIANLKQNGKQVRRASMDVQVLRRVTKVTLSRKNLVILEPDDPILADLLAPLPAEPGSDTDLTDAEQSADPGNTVYSNYPVIAVPVGRSVNLSAVCTPEDASNRKISYTSSDVGIAKIVDGSKIRGVEKGECELTVASVQNPEIQELFHVVVIEPVKKLKIEAPDKTMFAGTQMKLSTTCTPENASIRQVIWTSRKPSVATVDENGLVTGLAKGDVTIEAKATDGSGVSATFTLRVAQDVTEITLKQEELKVDVNKSVNLSATVLPKDANNRKVNWASSDETIAVVSKDGRITGKKAGICVITCTSDSNAFVSASAIVQVVQPVTKITFTASSGLNFPIHTSQQLVWNIEPSDATIKDVTFTSNHPEIATVDENGLVTGLKRGEARITATATDGSKRTGQIKVVITQPVEGVTLPQQLYYIQRGRGTNIRATVLPKDANNQKVYWEIDDPSIATVKSNGTSTGRVTGQKNGFGNVVVITEDGGFMASSQIRVADYDGAVMVEGLEITADNRIRITLRNLSDLVVEKVYFHIDCYDPADNPMIYNKDGETTGFDGSYPLPLMSGERSQHGQFDFGNWLDTGMLGAVVLTVTGYEFENGLKWNIPEGYRIPTMKITSTVWGQVTQTPMPPTNPEETAGDPNV